MKKRQRNKIIQKYFLLLDNKHKEYCKKNIIEDNRIEIMKEKIEKLKKYEDEYFHFKKDYLDIIEEQFLKGILFTGKYKEEYYSKYNITKEQFNKLIDYYSLVQDFFNLYVISILEEHEIEKIYKRIYNKLQFIFDFHLNIKEYITNKYRFILQNQVLQYKIKNYILKKYLKKKKVDEEDFWDYI